MAGSLNKVTLIGRLGKDPETRYTGSGDQVCTLALATSRTWTPAGGGERQEATEWHTVVAWRKLAEGCAEYLTKGRLILIEGRIETRNWEDKDTGKKVYRTEIIADNMVMLDARPGSAEDGNRDDAGASRDRPVNIRDRQEQRSGSPESRHDPRTDLGDIDPSPPTPKEREAVRADVAAYFDGTLRMPPYAHR